MEGLHREKILSSYSISISPSSWSLLMCPSSLSKPAGLVLSLSSLTNVAVVALYPTGILLTIVPGRGCTHQFDGLLSYEDGIFALWMGLHHDSFTGKKGLDEWVNWPALSKVSVSILLVECNVGLSQSWWTIIQLKKKGISHVKSHTRSRASRLCSRNLSNE